MVERRDFKYFGRCEPHFVGKRDQVRRAQTSFRVLDLVKVLDEVLAAPRRVAEERLHFFKGGRVDGPAFPLAALFTPRLAVTVLRSSRDPERRCAGDDVDRVPHAHLL